MVEVGVRERAAKRLWEAFDSAWASGPLTEVPDTSGEWLPWDAPIERGEYRRHLARPVTDGFDRQLTDQLSALWGHKVLARWPGRRIRNRRPELLAQQLLHPALGWWHAALQYAWNLADDGGRWRPDAFWATADHTQFRAWAVPDGRQLLDALDQRGASSYAALRQIVTVHRRRWAADHLVPVVEGWWQLDEADVVARHRRLVEKRNGRPLTVKMVAELTARVANQWAAGELSVVGELLDGVPPVEQTVGGVDVGDFTEFCNIVIDRFVTELRSHHDAMDVGRRVMFHIGHWLDTYDATDGQAPTFRAPSRVWSQTEVSDEDGFAMLADCIRSAIADGPWKAPLAPDDVVRQSVPVTLAQLRHALVTDPRCDYVLFGPQGPAVDDLSTWSLADRLALLDECDPFIQGREPGPVRMSIEEANVLGLDEVWPSLGTTLRDAYEQHFGGVIVH